MVVRSRYFEGEPCWADVAAPDMEAARRFYGAVFGWTFGVDTAGQVDHVLCLKNDRPVAALTSALPPAGEPPEWHTYLNTADADRAANRIAAAGGGLLTAMTETWDGSRMRLASDPGGATFGLWQPQGMVGSSLYGEPGAITWAEVNTHEPAAVDAFYGAVFGVQPLAWRDVPGEYPSDAPPEQTDMDYLVYTGADGGPMLSGRLTLTADFGEIPAHWMIYFNVDDADSAADRVTAAGGRVVAPPFDTPYGRMTVAADPSGAVLGLSAAAVARSRLARWAQS
jgi:predicted enzyme related to lactoylglutathione lyase